MIVLVLLWGCSSGGDECVTVDLSCSPLYTPTFDEIYSRTLVPKCTVGGGACHSAVGAAGDLVLEGIDTAFAGLTSEVEPGDPGCSDLLQRLADTDPSEGMPPGSPLSEAEQCVVIQWIAAGANR